ncbi:MAG: hypothetical protein WCR21_04040, partial [Bacteroidota bacterium]
MKKIDTNSRGIAIQIATNAFIENPSMNWFLNPKLSRDDAMQALCEHCIDIAILKGGAYISDDLCCICLLYHSQTKISVWESLKLNYDFIIKCSGWRKTFSVLKRQDFMQAMRLQSEHLYCQILASNKIEGKCSVIEAKNFMFEMSDRLHLPIVAETCLEKNKKVLEQKGNKYTLEETKIITAFLKE